MSFINQENHEEIFQKIIPHTSTFDEKTVQQKIRETQLIPDFLQCFR